MKGIGIRVGTKQVHYTIVDHIEQSFESNVILIPKAMDDDIPRQLSYIRTSLLSIICEFNVKVAGIRIAENISKNKDTFRIYVEGVIQELFSNSTVEKYFYGVLKTIAFNLEAPIEEVKSCLISNTNLLGVEWQNINKDKNLRESIIVALATKSLCEGVDVYV